jgi:hypothetical protein
MRTLFRFLALAVVALLLGSAVIAVLARFADGPVGPFPGGRLRGDVEATGAGWAESLAGVDSLELQVNTDAPRSVRVWFVVYGDVVYVPSAWAARKQWPAEVEQDPHVVVRANGHLYERSATRVADPNLVDGLLDAVADKYGAPRGDPDSTWFFRLNPAG